MGTRSVRLDDEAEQALGALAARTGASVSDLLKQGLLVLRNQTLERSEPRPWQIYNELDLGPGGYAVAPARESRQALRAILAGRHRRRQ